MAGSGTCFLFPISPSSWIPGNTDQSLRVTTLLHWRDMAVHLYLNASPFSSPPSPWRALHPNLKSFTPEKLIKLAPISKPRSSSQLSLSLQDQVVNGVQVDTNPPDSAEPDGNSASSPSSESEFGNKSKSSVWINPNSPRAYRIRMKSYNVRYPDLISTAEELNSCNPTFEDVSLVLDGLGGDMAVRDAVTVLNHMSNPETALVVLEYFLKNVKSVKQVVLYNVTLKVLRKCRDLQRAEKVFDEMLQRGVNPDNITFTITIYSIVNQTTLG